MKYTGYKVGVFSYELHSSFCAEADQRTLTKTCPYSLTLLTHKISDLKISEPKLQIQV